MVKNEKNVLLDILEKENMLLNQLISEQAKMRMVVKEKDWCKLQDAIMNIQHITDAFVRLEKEKSSIDAINSIFPTKQTAFLAMEIRRKILKAKVENKALCDYVRITRGFIRGILRNAVPQRRNTLYSKKGVLINPQPESVVIDQLF